MENGGGVSDTGADLVDEGKGGGGPGRWRGGWVMRDIGTDLVDEEGGVRVRDIGANLVDGEGGGGRER